MSYQLARPARLDILDVEAFARVTGLHPDLVRRLVAAGVLEAQRDASGTLWFGRRQLIVIGRAQRLRAAFALNYAALGLVVDLIDRIEALEASLARAPMRTEVDGGL